MKWSLKLLVLLTTLFIPSQQIIFAPHSAEEIRILEQGCVKLLLQPSVFWYKYLNLEYPDDPITHCHIRCLLIAAEFYDDELGAKLDNLFEQHQHDTPLDRTEWTEAKSICLARQFANGVPEDLCKRAYMTFKCFEIEFLISITRMDCNKISL
ncbi:AAEL007003-PA [Aedes aegypti]|uniref:AAEL007003-PA n=1 Tax=Aedes aegypti TaxID=7159 RepID=Q173T2_AEDAE|nr:AAEL007003-PA [Aedes aegypti]